ncbi:hypothetical protein [Pseudofrankia sp. DC12]|uniref:hypothetical protein n=1 Tax=Pseudofrankia sp. DC12 TaxID=683315 RepID=UPI0005F81E57|nr:hypothetical protein [Pseudofrankia sp. DC12]
MSTHTNDASDSQRSRGLVVPAPARLLDIASEPAPAHVDPELPAPGAEPVRQDAELAVQWAAALARQARQQCVDDGTDAGVPGSQLDGAVTLLDRHEAPGYIAHLIEHAHSEVLFLLAGPAEPEDRDDRLIEATLRAAARGVAFTSAWAPDLLAAYAAKVGERLGAVGEIHQSTELPTRMIVVDGHTAVLPIDADDLTQGALAVRTPALRHLVTGLIEEFYDNAAPASRGVRPDGQGH